MKFVGQDFQKLEPEQRDRNTDARDWKDYHAVFAGVRKENTCSKDVIQRMQLELENWRSAMLCVLCKRCLSHSWVFESIGVMRVVTCSGCTLRSGMAVRRGNVCVRHHWPIDVLQCRVVDKRTAHLYCFVYNSTVITSRKLVACPHVWCTCFLFHTEHLLPKWRASPCDATFFSRSIFEGHMVAWVFFSTLNSKASCMITSFPTTVHRLSRESSSSVSRTPSLRRRVSRV